MSKDEMLSITSAINVTLLNCQFFDQ
jgi:hypothetical protein